MAERTATRQADKQADRHAGKQADKQDRRSARTRRRFVRRQWARRWLTLRYVAAALVLVLLVGGSIYTVYYSPVLRVERAEVLGESTLSASTVLDAADVPTGGPLATADLVAISRRVAALASVQAVDVTRQWPHAVRIQVTERVPVAVVRRGEELRAIDAEGVLFTTYRAAPKNLPEIRASASTARDALAEGATVAAALPDRVAAMVDHLSLVSVDRIDLALRDGRTVRWGSAEDSAQKGEVLSALLSRPAQTYDVSVPGQPSLAG